MYLLHVFPDRLNNRYFSSVKNHQILPPLRCLIFNTLWNISISPALRVEFPRIFPHPAPTLLIEIQVTFLLEYLLRLFLINAVVISKPVVVIIFLLAFFILFLLQMVHNLGFGFPPNIKI